MHIRQNLSNFPRDFQTVSVYLFLCECVWNNRKGKFAGRQAQEEEETGILAGKHAVALRLEICFFFDGDAGSPASMEVSHHAKKLQISDILK